MSFQSDPNKSTFSASPVRSLERPVSSGLYETAEPLTFGQILTAPFRVFLGSRIALSGTLLALAAGIIWAL